LLKLLDSYTARIQRWSRFSRIASVAAHSGDSVVVIAALVLLLVLGGAALAVPPIAGLVASWIATTAIKYAVRRSRPPGDWGGIYRKTDPYSFPSGHAVRTVALSTLAFGLHGLSWGFGLVLWAVVVGLARIAMGVHYVTDVLAGYAVGIAVGGGVLAYFLATGA
jgi:undecaprenyl-diphosphatase